MSQAQVWVSGFQEEVSEALHVAVADYRITDADIAHLDEAISEVPTNIRDIDDDRADRLGLVGMVRYAYGKGFKPLTEALAEKLRGRTVPAISGQVWMDHIRGSTLKARRNIPRLHTIHGVFHDPAGGGKVCIVSEIRRRRRIVRGFPDRNTFRTTHWEGFYGSGSGHEPVMVFV